MRPERRIINKWGNLFLVRHGESTANEVNRFAGAVDAPLTKLGRGQAETAARNWRGEKIDLVIASPLTRACQTADILINSITQRDGRQPKLRKDARLCERHFGHFTLRNKTLTQRQVGLRRYEAAFYGNQSLLSDGELFQSFHNRLLDFLKKQLHPLLVSGKRVLVVAHKYVIELLSRLILRLPSEAGYDLRLPNATILSGSMLKSYLHRESRTLNLIQDWIVAYHSVVILGGVAIGLLLRGWLGEREFSPPLAFTLLILATLISLLRVSPRDLKAAFDERMLPGKRFLVRFALLPLAIGVFGMLADLDSKTWLLVTALFFAAPTAITALTISRSAGGMVLPSVYMILFSTLVSAFVMSVLLTVHGMTAVSAQAFVYASVSILGLFLPLLAARLLRSKYPISMANFAERNAALAVLLLTLFVILSFQSIRLDSFWPYGAAAFGIGLLIRWTAFSLTRRGSLYGIDDYVSMAYPNVFLVILLAEILNLESVMQLATWFLVPMFALAPLDDFLCRLLQKDTKDHHLLSFLGVELSPVRVAKDEEV